jgi:hypothetical protein
MEEAVFCWPTIVFHGSGEIMVFPALADCEIILVIIP